jgi:hypothetical protein
MRRRVAGQGDPFLYHFIGCGLIQLMHNMPDSVFLVGKIDAGYKDSAFFRVPIFFLPAVRLFAVSYPFSRRRQLHLKA